MNKKLKLIIVYLFMFFSFLPKVAAVIKINPAVDLAVFPEDISFSNASPKTGEQLTISAKIHNLGYRDVPSTEVKFYADSPDNQINGLLNAEPIFAEGFKYVIEAAGTQNQGEKSVENSEDHNYANWKWKKIVKEFDIPLPVDSRWDYSKSNPVGWWNGYDNYIAKGWKVEGNSGDNVAAGGQSAEQKSAYLHIKIILKPWDSFSGKFTVYGLIPVKIPWGPKSETGIASINTLTPTQVAAASLVAPNNDTTYSLKSVEVNGAVYTDSDGDGAIEGVGILAWMEGSKLMAMRGNHSKIENKNIRHVSYKDQTFTDYFYPSNRSSKILSWSYQVFSSTRNGVDDGTYIDFANNRLVIKSKLRRASSRLPSVYLANYQIHVASEGSVIAPKSISVNWIPDDEGDRKIYVSVNPSKQILEFNETNNTAFKTITVRPNNPPSKPIFLSSPSIGRVSKTYTFTASSSDTEHQKIKFVFDWGDGVIHETGYLDYSGQNVIGTLQHGWNYAGTYEVKVKAIDEGGKESEWSDSSQMNIQPLTDTKWETAIVETGQRYSPVLCNDSENNLYRISTQYRPTKPNVTAFQFFMSPDEGANFSYGSLPQAWTITGAVSLAPEITASSNSYEHTLYGHTVYENLLSVYYGWYKYSSVGQGAVNLLDGYKRGRTQDTSYNCVKPDIISYQGSLAAVWIRENKWAKVQGWGSNTINEDYITLVFSPDEGKRWGESQPIKLIGRRCANPGIAVDKNGILLIASSGRSFWNGMMRNVGILLDKIPYDPANKVWKVDQRQSRGVYVVNIQIPSQNGEDGTIDSQPRIAVDQNDAIHIVFDYALSASDFAQGIYHCIYMKSLNGGMTWEKIRDLGIGRKPEIAIDQSGKPRIVYIKNAEVYYVSPAGEQEVISSWRGKVNSSPRIICTDNYVHVTWRESEDDGTNSVYYSRLKLSQFEISGVHCAPNPELATALLDVPDYDQNIPPFQNILPDQLWISFVVKNGFYRQHKINVEIFTDDGVTLVKRLMVNQPEFLDIDPSGGYAKHFVNYTVWNGRSDILFPDPYGKPWNGYVPPGFTWKIKITVQEIDDNGKPGKTTTNWVDWNGWNAGYRIIPKSSLSMDPDGSRKGLRASYSDGTVIEGEGPINHGRGGLPSFGLDLSSYYQGLPGDWAGKWDINGKFREILNGYIYAPITGEYKFKLVVDDYGALVVNGWVICTYDNSEAPGEVFGNIPLEGGKWYPIYMEYENRKGTNGLGLYWNIEVNQNFIFTDPTFIQVSRKDIKAFQEFLEGNTISGDEKKDNVI